MNNRRVEIMNGASRNGRRRRQATKCLIMVRHGHVGNGNGGRDSGEWHWCAGANEERVARHGGHI